MSNFMLCNPHHLLFVDKIKTNEMGSVCSAYRTRRDSKKVWWGKLREGEHLEHTSENGRIILK
jgi:hypothetical protein